MNEQIIETMCERMTETIYERMTEAMNVQTYEELHGLYHSPNIVRLITSRRLR